jgi:hypothetical protein
MRKRTLELLQHCVDVLESADLEDVEALIGQLRELFRGRKADQIESKESVAWRSLFQTVDCHEHRPRQDRGHDQHQKRLYG